MSTPQSDDLFKRHQSPSLPKVFSMLGDLVLPHPSANSHQFDEDTLEKDFFKAITVRAFVATELKEHGYSTDLESFIPDTRNFIKEVYQERIRNAKKAPGERTVEIDPLSSSWEVEVFQKVENWPAGASSTKGVEFPEKEIWENLQRRIDKEAS